MRAATVGRGIVALFCSGLVGTSALAASSVKASTVLKDESGITHGADLAFDGLLSTSWAEGEVGNGEGSWIELTFDKPVSVESISMWPGDLSKDERALKENGRPKQFTVELIGGAEPVTAVGTVRDVAQHGIQRIDVPVVGEATRVRIRIDEVYGGFLRNDTYVAEVAVNFAAGTTPAFDRLDAWLASDAGGKAVAAHKEAVVGLFDRIDQAEFGDRDALGLLMAWTSDGAPYLRDRVKREAPLGFRVQALPSDDAALEALLKIKDPVAIPAVELAALRSRGREARRLTSLVSYFEAYADLKGGGRRAIDPWGQRGWEKGAIRAFSEPVGIALGAYGDLYIADVANHRVDVFGQDGRIVGVWGVGDPNITDVWFGTKRKHYVAGREPSREDGGFTNPIAIATVPGTDPDEVVVLDALGRLTWLDSTGRALRVVKLETSPAEPGVGSGGHLLMTGRTVVAIVNDHAFVVDPDGTTRAAWRIEDGAPVTAAVLRNGRLALGFARGVVEYDASGFRHGELMGGDVLPPGYEAWALGVDEKGKLWAVTDRGDAVKFKRPGKVDYTVRFSRVGISPPRFVVYDDMLYVATDGKIFKVDALTLRDNADESADSEQPSFGE